MMSVATKTVVKTTRTATTTTKTRTSKSTVASVSATADNSTSNHSDDFAGQEAGVPNQQQRQERVRRSTGTAHVARVMKRAGSTAHNKVKTVGKGAVGVAGKAGKGTVKVVGKGVGVAGKGTVKVGKGTFTATKLVGTKTAKGTFTAAKFVGKNAVTVGKGTVGAVSNLPGNAIDVAGLTVKGVTNLPGNALHLAGNLTTLAARNFKKSDASSQQAWKTPLTSPVTQIELEIECHNLRRKDAFAECDAFAVLWEAPTGFRSEAAIGKVGEDSLNYSNGNMSFATLMDSSQQGRGNNQRQSQQQQSSSSSSKRPRVNRLPTHAEKEIGRTEVIKGNRNPKFEYTFTVDYRFQIEQTYVVRVYDRDLEFCPDLKEHDFLGGTVFTLGELMGVRKRTLKRPLRNIAKQSDGTRVSKHKSNRPVLYIRGNEVKTTRSVLEFRFSAQGLKEKDKVIDKDDDPYFQIMKLNPEDQTWQAVYKSEVLLHNTTPTWAKASLPLPVLCDNSLDALLRIAFWDWIRGAQSEPLGYVETTVRDLVDGASRGIPVYDVYRDKKRMFGGSKVKRSGKMKVLRADLKQVPTMLEYIAGGCTIDLTLAVDCSSRNGDCNTEGGLHYRPGPMWLNDYQAAIHKIGAILEQYSHNQEFNIVGFGASVRGESVSQFPLGKDDGFVKGANGLLEAYDTTFVDNPLYIEPRDDVSIAPLIQTAMYRAIQKSDSETCYSLLCILTAGSLGKDLLTTIDTICTAAEDAPMSIVIIGIGDNEEDFEDIKLVLANGGKLRHSNGVPIARDITCFASFPDHEFSAGKVVEEAFKDLPEQFVEYFTMNGITPREPQIGGSDDDDDELADSMQDESRNSHMGGSSRRRGDTTRRSPRSPQKKSPRDRVKTAASRRMKAKSPPRLSEISLN